ncbi:MAG: hypothetical protein E6Q97_22060 [Desulfurellales bacterium]|nr:MAG: hypothetical protein E6Q97_22060 [Desulfurellales bacterium]
MHLGQLPGEELPETATLEDQLSQAVIHKRELEELVESRGWRRLCAHLQAQLDGRVRELVLRQTSSLDMTFQTEYDRGRIAEQLCLPDMPQELIAAFTLTIEQIKLEIEAHARQENENESKAE